MDKESLPLKVDPFRFAENAIHLQGVVPFNDMPDLCPSLESSAGDAVVEMVFGVDEQGTHFLKGHLDAKLVLQCQRCMNAFDYAIMTDFLLGIVHSDDEADTLPDSYDPVIVKENTLFLKEVVEQELIVSLPIVPMHDEQACQVRLPFVASTSSDAEMEKDNPFKVIETLRNKRNVIK